MVFRFVLQYFRTTLKRFLWRNKAKIFKTCYDNQKTSFSDFCSRNGLEGKLDVIGKLNALSKSAIKSNFFAQKNDKGFFFHFCLSENVRFLDAINSSKKCKNKIITKTKIVCISCTANCSLVSVSNFLLKFKARLINFGSKLSFRFFLNVAQSEGLVIRVECTLTNAATVCD